MGKIYTMHSTSDVAIHDSAATYLKENFTRSLWKKDKCLGDSPEEILDKFPELSEELLKLYGIDYLNESVENVYKAIKESEYIEKELFYIAYCKKITSGNVIINHYSDIREYAKISGNNFCIIENIYNGKQNSITLGAEVITIQMNEVKYAIQAVTDDTIVILTYEVDGLIKYKTISQEEFMDKIIKKEVVFV